MEKRIDKLVSPRYFGPSGQSSSFRMGGSTGTALINIVSIGRVAHLNRLKEPFRVRLLHGEDLRGVTFEARACVGVRRPAPHRWALINNGPGGSFVTFVRLIASDTTTLYPAQINNGPSGGIGGGL